MFFVVLGKRGSQVSMVNLLRDYHFKKGSLVNIGIAVPSSLADVYLILVQYILTKTLLLCLV